MRTKRCVQRGTSLNYVLRIVITEPEPIHCGRCNRPINQKDPLAFGGGLACELCVRAYYNPHRELTRVLKDDFETYIQSELGFRRSLGAKTLKQILQAKRREQEKRDRRRAWGE